MDLDILAQLWLSAKKREQEANEERKSIEDRLTALLNLQDDIAGTETFETDRFKIKAAGSMTSSVDKDILRDVARDNNLEKEIDILFSWTPKMNKKIWDKTDDKITRVLAQAVTIKPSRKTFTILESEQ